MLSRALASFFILALASCLNSRDYDLDSVTLSPEVAFPLASGDIGIIDLLSSDDSSYLKVYPDGLTYLSYSNTLNSTAINELFKFDDNTSDSYFNLPSGTQGITSSDIPGGTINKVVDLGLSPAKLSEALLDSGTLNFTISFSPSNGVNPASLPIEVIMTLTDVVDKNTLEPMVITSAKGTGSRSLRYYMLKMVNNKFDVKLDLVLKKRTSSFYVAAGTKVDVKLSFDDLRFNYINGFFGDQVATITPRSIPLTIFESSLNKPSISFVQPSIKLSVQNEYGVPCEVTFTKLEARKPGSTMAVQISPASPITLSFPTQPGSSALTTVTVNNTQSIINFNPTELYYSASARINKLITNGSNFLSDTSRLRVTLDTELPLYGHADKITISDTLDLDLEGANQSKILKGSLQVKALNELPLDARIQLYFTDKDYTVIDSVFDNNQTYIVKASKVKSTGELDEAGVSDLKLELSTQKLDKMFTSRFLIISAKMNTTKDAGGNLLNVKFKSTYRLRLHLGLLAKLDLVIK